MAGGCGDAQGAAMSMIKFATLCDKCEARSEEYTTWPTCRECMDDVCPKCSSEPTEDERHQALCHECKEWLKRCDEPHASDCSFWCHETCDCNCMREVEA